MRVPNKRQKKPQGAPKRAMSAFLSYSQAMRPSIRAQQPQLKNTEISSVLADRWRSASEEEKRPHLEKEVIEREKYHHEMVRWKEEEGHRSDQHHQTLQQQPTFQSQQSVVEPISSFESDMDLHQYAKFLGLDNFEVDDQELESLIYDTGQPPSSTQSKYNDNSSTSASSRSQSIRSGSNRSVEGPGSNSASSAPTECDVTIGPGLYARPGASYFAPNPVGSFLQIPGSMPAPGAGSRPSGHSDGSRLGPKVPVPRNQPSSKRMIVIFSFFFPY